MAINTVFQLLAEEGSTALARRRAPRVDPRSLRAVAQRRAGQRADHRVHDRASRRPLGCLGRRPDRRAGAARAPVRRARGPRHGAGARPPEHELGSVPVFAVASHDTASAFVATPVRDEHAAILSSGTWSLLGVELAHPALDGPARDADLTNERGVDGTTRLLKNVMGLWLEQECARAGGPITPSCSARAPRRAAPCRSSTQTTRRCCARRHAGPYRRGVRRNWAAGAGRPRADGRAASSSRSRASTASCSSCSRGRAERELRRIHVVGGGARIEALCRLTADITRSRGPRRAGRGHRAGQRPRPGPGRRRARLARRDARGRRGIEPCRTLRAVAATRRARRDVRALPRAHRPAPGDPRMSHDAIEQAVGASCVDRDPSWGYGDSGTRFGTFPQPGRPRDVFERVDDAAEVHRLTGTAGAVALHFPWDAVDDYDALREHIEARGLRVGAVNPNLFQDRDYKLGSVTHPDAARARQGGRAPARVRRDRDARSARARSRCGWPTARTTRARTTCAAPARACSTALAQVYAALPRRAGAARRVQALRARVLRHRPRRLGLARCCICQQLGERARCSSTSATTRRASNIEQIVALARRRGPARRLSLQQPQVRRRRPRRRLGQPVRAVPRSSASSPPPPGRCRG